MRGQAKTSPPAQSFKGKTWTGRAFTDSEFYLERGKIKKGKKGKIEYAPYIIPPYSDPHIHGGWGFSFQKGEFEALERKLRGTGVSFAIPTLENDELEHLRRIARTFREYRRKNPRSIFPFLRVEGPFISMAKRGAQNASFIQKPDRVLIEQLLSIDEIRLFTFAPEVEGVRKFVERALEKGKFLSIGHSNARFNDVLKFYRKGIRHMTHFPNAMSELHHREIGVTGAGFSLEGLQLEVIADGIHTSFDFISLLLRAKSPVFSITSDLIPAAFSRIGKGKDKKLIKDGRKITTENGTLAGGSTTVAEQVTLLHRKGIKPEDLVRLTCLNARSFFSFPLPSLEEGEAASFLLLDENMEMKAVYADGERIG